ncbi:hypothetical protein TNCV_1765051 [Trichonephila clavipes]|nr:hypothetical protein TNCV_1765051 [Trichonephila clavipes]
MDRALQTGRVLCDGERLCSSPTSTTENNVQVVKGIVMNKLCKLGKNMGTKIAPDYAGSAIVSENAGFVYLHRLVVAANEACSLSGHARMDGDHLLQCTGIDEKPSDDNVSQYWEVRCQMVKKPNTGVG